MFFVIGRTNYFGFGFTTLGYVNKAVVSKIGNQQPQWIYFEEFSFACLISLNVNEELI